MFAIKRVSNSEAEAKLKYVLGISRWKQGAMCVITLTPSTGGSPTREHLQPEQAAAARYLKFRGGSAELPAPACFEVALFSL